MKTSLFCLAILFTLLSLSTASPSNKAYATRNIKPHLQFYNPLNLNPSQNDFSAFPAANFDYRQMLIDAKFDSKQRDKCWDASHNQDLYYCRGDVRESFHTNKIYLSETCCDALNCYIESCPFHRNPFLDELVKLHCSGSSDDVLSPPSD